MVGMVCVGEGGGEEEMAGGRGDGKVEIMDVIRFLHETPLFFSILGRLNVR